MNYQLKELLLKQITYLHDPKAIDYCVRQYIKQGGDLSQISMDGASLATKYYYLKRWCSAVPNKQISHTANTLILEQLKKTNFYFPELMRQHKAKSMRDLLYSMVQIGIRRKPLEQVDKIVDYLPLEAQVKVQFLIKNIIKFSLKMLKQSTNLNQYLIERVSNALIEQLGQSDLRCDLYLLLKWMLKVDESVFSKFGPLILNELIWDMRPRNARQHNLVINFLIRCWSVLENKQHCSLAIRVYFQRINKLLKCDGQAYLKLKLIKLSKESQIELPQELDLSVLIGKLGKPSLKVLRLLQEKQGEYLSRVVIDDLQVLEYGVQYMSEEQLRDVLDQLLQRLDVDDLFVQEFVVLFRVLQEIENDEILIQLLRIFSDRHMIFSSDEFEQIMKEVMKLKRVDMSDEYKVYKESIVDEVAEYCKLKNINIIINLNKE